MGVETSNGLPSSLVTIDQYSQVARTSASAITYGDPVGPIAEGLTQWHRRIDSLGFLEAETGERHQLFDALGCTALVLESVRQSKQPRRRELAALTVRDQIAVERSEILPSLDRPDETTTIVRELRNAESRLVKRYAKAIGLTRLELGGALLNTRIAQIRCSLFRADHDAISESRRFGVESVARAQLGDVIATAISHIEEASWQLAYLGLDSPKKFQSYAGHVTELMTFTYYCAKWYRNDRLRWQDSVRNSFLREDDPNAVHHIPRRTFDVFVAGTPVEIKSSGLRQHRYDDRIARVAMPTLVSSREASEVADHFRMLLDSRISTIDREYAWLALEAYFGDPLPRAKQRLKNQPCQ